MAALAAAGLGMAAASALTIENALRYGRRKPVDIYTFTNSHRMEIKVTTYGGIVTSLVVPDKKRGSRRYRARIQHDRRNIRLLTISRMSYFGALIGRYGNRIGGAKFTLEGKEYTLAKNNGPNSLHGGVRDSIADLGRESSACQGCPWGSN